MIVSLMVLLPTLTIPAVSAEEKPYTVNTLLYFDEEVTDDYHRQFIYENFFTPRLGLTWWPYNRFLNEQNIKFVCVNGWNDFWDSDDTESNAYDMLEEAIEDIGFESGMMYETAPNYVQVVDLLICYTGQAMDLRGFSLPMWNACIMRNEIPIPGVATHELSHQFGALHCPHFCVMNPTFVDFCWSWCSDCWTTIHNHRDKWSYKYNLTISAGSGGTTDPTPRTYEYYEETTVEVTAIPTCGYSFDHWILDGATESGNPITVTMDSDHNLKAYFEEDSSGGGGGDNLFTPDSTYNQT